MAGKDTGPPTPISELKYERPNRIVEKSSGLSLWNDYAPTREQLLEARGYDKSEDGVPG